MSDRSLYFLTPDVILRAYAAGIFPMAVSGESRELHWFDPPIRAIIPLDDMFHLPKRLQKTIRQKPYAITYNMAFERVIRACAEPIEGRETTWINRDLIEVYCALHRRGYAHSVEVWSGNDLVGGVYGVSLGSAFFGESMFSRRTDASKIALVYLVALLRSCGFTLLDTQFQTNHLAQFGAHEITRANYQHLLRVALKNAVLMKEPEADRWSHLAGEFLHPVIHKS